MNKRQRRTKKALTIEFRRLLRDAKRTECEMRHLVSHWRPGGWEAHFAGLNLSAPRLSDEELATHMFFDASPREVTP